MAEVTKTEYKADEAQWIIETVGNGAVVSGAVTVKKPNKTGPLSEEARDPRGDESSFNGENRAKVTDVENPKEAIPALSFPQTVTSQSTTPSTDEENDTRNHEETQNYNGVVEEMPDALDQDLMSDAEDLQPVNVDPSMGKGTSMNQIEDPVKLRGGWTQDDKCTPVLETDVLEETLPHHNVLSVNEKEDAQFDVSGIRNLINTEDGNKADTSTVEEPDKEQMEPVEEAETVEDPGKIPIEPGDANFDRILSNCRTPNVPPGPTAVVDGDLTEPASAAENGNMKYGVPTAGDCESVSGILGLKESSCALSNTRPAHLTFSVESKELTTTLAVNNEIDETKSAPDVPFKNEEAGKNASGTSEEPMAITLSKERDSEKAGEDARVVKRMSPSGALDKLENTIAIEDEGLLDSVEAAQGSAAEDIAAAAKADDVAKPADPGPPSQQIGVGDKKGAESGQKLATVRSIDEEEEQPMDAHTETPTSVNRNMEPGGVNVRTQKKATKEFASDVSTVSETTPSAKATPQPALVLRGVERKEFGTRLPWDKPEMELSVPFDETKRPIPSPRKIAIPAAFSSPPSNAAKPVASTASPRSPNKSGSEPLAFSSPVRLWDVTTSERFSASSRTKSTDGIALPTLLSTKRAEILDGPLHRSRGKKIDIPPVFAAASTRGHGHSKTDLDKKMRITPPGLSPDCKLSSHAGYERPETKKKDKYQHSTEAAHAGDGIYVAERVVLDASESAIETEIKRSFDDPPTSDELLLLQQKQRHSESVCLMNGASALPPFREDTVEVLKKQVITKLEPVCTATSPEPVNPPVDIAASEVQQSSNPTSAEAVIAPEGDASERDTDRNADATVRVVGTDEEMAHLQEQAICCFAM